MGCAGSEGDRGAEAVADEALRFSRYKRVQDRLLELGGVRHKTFRATSGTPQTAYELEVWTAAGKLFIVQYWPATGSVEVYAPITSSLSMDELLAAIK